MKKITPKVIENASTPADLTTGSAEGLFISPEELLVSMNLSEAEIADCKTWLAQVRQMLHTDTP